MSTLDPLSAPETTADLIARLREWANSLEALGWESADQAREAADALTALQAAHDPPAATREQNHVLDAACRKLQWNADPAHDEQVRLTPAQCRALLAAVGEPAQREDCDIPCGDLRCVSGCNWAAVGEPAPPVSCACVGPSAPENTADLAKVIREPLERTARNHGLYLREVEAWAMLDALAALQVAHAKREEWFAHAVASWKAEEADWVREREQMRQALAFYADPETYFGVGIFGDEPAGEFMDDFSEVPWPDGGTNVKPGARARAALAAAGEPAQEDKP